MTKSRKKNKSTATCPLKGTLLISVLKKGDRSPAAGVKVTYSGPESGSGVSDGQGFFEKTALTPGTYSFTIDLAGTSFSDQTASPAFGSANVPKNDASYDVVELSLLNVVTPKITPATGTTQALLKENPPATAPPQIEIDHRFQPEPADVPDVTPLKLKFSYDETKPAKAYTGDGTVTGVGVTLFKDAECTEEFNHAAGGKLTNTELKAGIALWLLADTAGDIDVGLKLDASDDTEISVEEDAAATVTVDPAVKRITPILTPEYLIVLKDRELWKQQRKNDSKDGSAAVAADEQIKPDAVRLIAKIKESAGDTPYTGQGTLTIPANIALFTDEALQTTFDASAKIAYDDLKEDGLTLWMHGKTTGKFNISLELDPSTDPKLLIDPKAEGELGCVELTYKLHHFTEADVNKAIDPEVAECTTYWDELKGLDLAQKEMTDTEKAKPGRMLHKQDTEKHHQRAKLIAQKVDESHWPDKAKSYELVLSMADGDKKAKTRAGSLKAFTAATGGTEKNLPHKITYAAAKDAEQELWIEGADIGDGWRSVRLSLGVDRATGGPAKTPKQDGDWAAFSVVRIKEVLCKVENEPGADTEKVIDGTKFYINLHDKGRELKDKAGISKCAVTAELEPKLQDVDIRFQVVEHKDIYAIADAPTVLKEGKIQDLKQEIKPVDRPDPKKLLHHKAATDAQGKAKTVDLQSPQIALAKFKIGAYLLQDAEQARFIDDHADLKKTEPVLSDDWLEIWRRLFFKVIAMKRWSGTSYSDRFDEAALKTQMEALGITLEKKGSSLEQPYKSTLIGGTGPGGYVHWSRAPFGGGVAPARTMHLCLISGRHKGVDVKTLALGNPTSKLKSWTISGLMRVKGTTNTDDWLDTCKATHLGVDYDLTAKASLTQLEDFKFRINIDFTDIWDQIKAANAADGDGGNAKANDFLTTATLDFKWKESKSSSGVSFYEAVVVCMDTREPRHATQNAKDSATHTFLHEIGHYVGLAAKELADKSATPNPNFYSETAGEDNVNGSGHGNPVLAGETSWGMGPHCDSTAGTGTCLMWHSFKMTLDYCDTCKFNVRTRVLHTPKVNARNVF